MKEELDVVWIPIWSHELIFGPCEEVDENVSCSQNLSELVAFCWTKRIKKSPRRAAHLHRLFAEYTGNIL